MSNPSIVIFLRPGVIGGASQPSNPPTDFITTDVFEDIFESQDSTFTPLFVIDEVEV